jgi:hypothetical protein
MFGDRETDFGEISKQIEILNRDDLSPTREMRWTKLVDRAERSLHWLIPAIVLTYIVFKLIRALMHQV